MPDLNAKSATRSHVTGPIAPESRGADQAIMRAVTMLSGLRTGSPFLI